MNETTFYWIVPATVELKKHKKLTLDLTVLPMLFIINKVWEREIEYSFNDALRNIETKEISSFNAHLYPRLKNGAVGEAVTLQNIEEVCGSFSKRHIKELQENKVLRSNGIIVFELRISKNLGIGPKNISDLDFIEQSYKYQSLIKEVATCYKVATTLSFPCDYVMFRATSNEASGVFIIKNGTHKHIEPLKSTNFGFPVIIDEAYLPHYQLFIYSLAMKWHCNLWPLKRFDFALNAEFIEMENLLDLLFALEGLFEKNASSEFIKLACALISSDDMKSSKRVNEILSCSFQLRNEIVHGSKYYTGMEKIKLGGKEILSQKIFWELRTIVAKMINFSIEKLFTNEEMKNLRITNEDIIQMYFKQELSKNKD